MTIFSGSTALCNAFGGGLVKYKSGVHLVSVARMINRCTYTLR